jgi:membrane protein YqaA with SNARE-associated domain
MDTVPTERTNVVRRLYDWVLSWADSPHANWALFVLSFAESSFFPIPPDILLIALAISAPTRAFRYAFICTLASVLGGVLGYGIGHFGYDTIGRPIIELYHGESVMASIKAQYDAYGFWGVLIAAITPIPYKVFTISSGFFDFDFLTFIVASVAGRTLRFFAVAGLIWKFGPAIKAFIDKYFNILAVAFVILLLGGFLLVKNIL